MQKTTIQVFLTDINSNKIIILHKAHDLRILHGKALEYILKTLNIIQIKFLYRSNSRQNNKFIIVT